MCVAQNQTADPSVLMHAQQASTSRCRGTITLFIALLFGVLTASHSVAQENSVLIEDIASVAVKATRSAQVVETLQSCGRINPVCVQPNDEVWLVNARESHLNPCDMSLIRCSRLENGQWNNANLNELVNQHKVDKNKQTMIYVHGNRTELKWAKSRGMQFYENAMQSTNRPPMRYVIYAWKSEREIPRLLRDFQIKSDRSVVIGTAFGQLLDQFSDRQIVLGGFSLGAQVVLTAVAETQLHDERPGKYRVAIFAPALNPDYVVSEMTHFANCENVERTDVFKNRGDRAVQVSQLITRKRANAFVSTLSQLAQTCGMSANRICVHDITAEVTKQHSIIKYSRSPLLVCKLTEMLCEQFTSMPTTEAETHSLDAPTSEQLPSVYVGKIEVGPAPTMKLSFND